jgi:beta-glucosidase-like glycosyl hydrolase
MHTHPPPLFDPQIALKNGKPWALMTAYNRVNGVHVSEDKRLLQEILMKVRSPRHRLQE